MSASEISIDVDQLDSIPAKSLLKLIEVRQKVNGLFRAWQKTLQECAPLFRYLEDQEIDLRFDPDLGHMNFHFSGTGDRFGEVWAELRRHGFIPSSRPKKGDTSFYCYWTRDGYARIFMNFESTLCKRVQVGTKMVEQPIYETHCGDPLPEVDTDNAITRAAEAAAALPAPETEIPF